MRKTAYVLLTSVLFFGSASLAFANISYDSGAPTLPQPQFSFYCTPYNAPFAGGSFYQPSEGGVCHYGLTSQELSSPNIFLAVYKGTPGNATLVDFDFGAQPGPSEVFTIPNSFGGSQGDDFFSVAVGYNDFSDVLAEDAYFESGGSAPLPYSVVQWKYGVLQSSPLTVTADNQSAQYGGPLPNLTATLSGFVNGDSTTSSDVTGAANCSTGATSASPVGTYPINCALGTLASAGNYTFNTFVPGTLTINPAGLTVTANPASALYGSPTPLLSAVISGFVNGDNSSVVSGSASCSTSATSASPAGSYTINCTAGTLSTSNYSFTTFFPALFVVNKALLTITADNKTMVASSSVPTLTSTLSGFVNGQTLATSGVTGGASCSTTATSASPAGNYPITCSAGSLVSTNYSFTTFVAGTLTVTAPPPPPDHTPPVIVITNPLKDGLYAKTDSVLVTATVTDASAIATTTYWFGNTKINPLQPLPLSTVTTPSIQAVSVSARDIYGNTSTTTVKFFVVKATNSCLLDIVSVVTLILQDKTFPDKVTLDQLISDCSALLKNKHRYDQ